MAGPAKTNRGEWIDQHAKAGFVRRRPGDILEFTSSHTEWRQRIFSFLERCPNSTLLAIVQHLWPEFLTLPPERRVRVWFWVKTQLLEMEREGVHQCQSRETEVPRWALNSHRRHAGDRSADV